jgi:hypothetical protein
LNQKQGIAKKIIAIVLLLALMAPLLVQGLHRHGKEHCCTIDSPIGFSSASHHHSVKSCLICNFEYVQFIPPVDCHLPDPETTSFKLHSPIYQSKAKSETRFAALRAPPQS